MLGPPGILQIRRPATSPHYVEAKKVGRKHSIFMAASWVVLGMAILLTHREDWISGTGHCTTTTYELRSAYVFEIG